MFVRETPVQRDWFVANTQPHREDFAAENLARQGFIVYCPKIIRRVTHARRTEDAARPLFPGYLFIGRISQTQPWRPILGTFGVRSLILQAGLPATLPPGFVEGLRAREIGGVIQMPDTPFEAGQKVAVNGGPFDGIIGQIVELREKDRIVVLLDLLNRPTKVQVKATKLRAI